MPQILFARMSTQRFGANAESRFPHTYAIAPAVHIALTPVRFISEPHTRAEIADTTSSADIGRAAAISFGIGTLSFHSDMP